ncbi:sodium:solute symporter [Capnocytophaga stomatis]|uniref:Sodium:solute symporter n=1 Tax=Capnocytophaga stomatis TaxID=1848904 RepID=A0A250G2X1_9FLAO|nr:sodium:solute symporter [Capnocytophaga stomatis]
MDNTDYESLISILREAYYSINCDYFLAAYLQYPNYNDKPNGDFLKPYFELWQRGFRFVINDNKLILF